MLEIPEATTISQQLNDTVKGKTIARVSADDSSHAFAFFVGTPAAYDSELKGKVWGRAEPSGGLIDIEVEDYRISFGDGVNVRYLEAGETPPKKTLMQIEFEDGSSIVCTVQMYGCLRVFVDGEPRDDYYYEVTKEKPSPLSDEFSREYFRSIVDEAKPSLSAKGLLATEQRIPGLGNGTCQDILFNADIHPKKKVSTLSDEKIDSLYASIKSTLSDMIAGGGRDTDKDLFGEPGRYQTILSSRSWKAPCPQCGGVIERKAFLGGNIYYCPRCQEL